MKFVQLLIPNGLQKTKIKVNEENYFFLVLPPKDELTLKYLSPKYYYEQQEIELTARTIERTSPKKSSRKTRKVKKSP